jgi:hypothetical protein
VVINQVSISYKLFMYEQDFKQDVGVVSLAIHAKGDFKRFTPGGRDTLRKVGPHGTEGVRCTLARFSSVK